ncbi:c-type cytochrome [Pseudoponticoccus marisrubri]|uniref:Cytochrome C n=1 Tax=Pseudoponticoccus marisrubri TaxID=1685382 RepID=A0A0W7WPZ5_9RHOB|nr:c-type cytochrome [Pseudoponticoccus marisrubri]KUF12609.1 cytochrome C [Pseudoponticoccus marisrubri]
MFDTMTFTKVVGGVCGSLLVFLLGKWAAETMYHGGGGHGDDHAAAYVIETGGGDEPPEPVEEVDFATLMAEADAGKGERVFGKCKACHKLDGSNAVGPYLNGVVGRDIGAVDGFGYSGNLEQVGDAWTPENLNAFLENPRNAAPGTTMSFNGLSSAVDRANVIAYLQGTDS